MCILCVSSRYQWCFFVFFPVLFLSFPYTFSSFCCFSLGSPTKPPLSPAPPWVLTSKPKISPMRATQTGEIKGSCEELSLVRFESAEGPARVRTVFEKVTEERIDKVTVFVMNFCIHYQCQHGQWPKLGALRGLFGLDLPTSSHISDHQLRNPRNPLVRQLIIAESAWWLDHDQPYDHNHM